MYSELKGKELNEWKNDIKEVSKILYNGVTEYTVNHHYLVIESRKKVKMIDLQYGTFLLQFT